MADIIDIKICYKCGQKMLYNSHLGGFKCVQCNNIHKIDSARHNQEAVNQPDKETPPTDEDATRRENDQFDQNRYISNIISDTCILMGICGLM